MREKIPACYSLRRRNTSDVGDSSNWRATAIRRVLASTGLEVRSGKFVWPIGANAVENSPWHAGSRNSSQHPMFTWGGFGATAVILANRGFRDRNAFSRASRRPGHSSTGQCVRYSERLSSTHCALHKPRPALVPQRFFTSRAEAVNPESSSSGERILHFGIPILESACHALRTTSPCPVRNGVALNSRLTRHTDSAATGHDRRAIAGGLRDRHT